MEQGGIETGLLFWCRDESGGCPRFLARRCPAWRRHDRDQQPEDASPEREKCHSQRCCTSSRTTSASTRQGVLPPCSGHEVRLRYAYFIRCTGVVKDARRERGRGALYLRPGDTRRQRRRRPQGQGHDSLGERGTAVDAEVRLYDHLFAKPDPDDAPEGQTLLINLNPSRSRG